MNKPKPTVLTKEQMVREMREAAANTAKVKAPKRKTGNRRTK